MPGFSCRKKGLTKKIPTFLKKIEIFLKLGIDFMDKPRYNA